MNRSFIPCSAASFEDAPAASREFMFMNETESCGKTLLQRMLDYRNCATQLRIFSEDMQDLPAVLMLSIAASYDTAAETAGAILLQSSELISDSAR
jgi:hypothetical protein